MTNTNGGSLVKSASENYPAILSGTHSDYGSTLGLYRSIQVSGVHIYGTMKTGNNAFENGSKLTILGNTKWFDKTGGGAEIKIPLTDSASNDTRQTLDVSGASVHIKIPVYMSGAAIVKDAALYVNKFPKPPLGDGDTLDLLKQLRPKEYSNLMEKINNKQEIKEPQGFMVKDEEQ